MSERKQRQEERSTTRSAALVAALLCPGAIFIVTPADHRTGTYGLGPNGGAPLKIEGREGVDGASRGRGGLRPTPAFQQPWQAGG
jgi:hypothetical protein